MAGQFAASIGALVLVKVLTERLPPAAYGTLTLALTVVTLVTQVGLGGINAACSRYYAIAVEQSSTAAFLAAMKRIVGVAIAAGLGIALVLAVALPIFGGYSYLWIGIAACAYAVFAGCSSIMNNVLNSARWRAAASLHQAMDPWGRIVLVAIVTWIWTASVEVVLAAFCSAALGLMISQVGYLRKLMSSSPAATGGAERMLGDILSFSLPFLPWTLMVWLQQVSERWFLQLYAGPADVGIYAVLYQLGYAPVVMIYAVAIRFLQPIVYAKASASNDGLAVEGHVKKAMLIGLASGLVAIVATAILHRQIFSLLVGKDYATHSYLLPWFVFAGSLFGLGEILLMKMQTEMKSIRLSKVKTLMGLMGLVLNFAGAYGWGLNGVVAATLTFSVANIVAMHFACNRAA